MSLNLSPVNPSQAKIGSKSSATEQCNLRLVAEPKKREKVYPEPVNRTRAKNTKSRNGCKTCKLRRVKCDETQPSCNRCRKFGVKCDGYNVPQVVQAKQVTLLPKSCCPILPSPVSALFRNENEYQYFTFFRDDVACDISGPIPTDLWKIVMLRSSVEEPALRHMAIAVAALRKSQAVHVAVEATGHHRFAVQQYGRALKMVQAIIAVNRQNEGVRISLVASILIFCFENLLGEHEQAVTHVKSALNLMHKRLSTSAKRYSRLSATRWLPDIDDDVLHIFVRLDNTIMSRLAESHDQPRTSRLHLHYDHENFRIPRVFINVTEAKNYLEHIQFRAMPFLSHMPDFFAHGNTYAPHVNDEEFHTLASGLREFNATFEPMLARAKEGSYYDFASAAAVKIMALVTDISILRVYYGNGEIPTDAFVSQSRETVDLCRRIVRDPRFKKTFVMDCGTIPALFVTVMICRDREIREEAVVLLRESSPRMEVVWDASTIADVCENMMRAEDQRAKDLLTSQTDARLLLDVSIN